MVKQRQAWQCDGSEMSINNEDSSREGKDGNIDINHTGIDEMNSNAHEDNGMQYLSEEMSDTEQEEQGICLGEQPAFHPPCNPLLNTTSMNCCHRCVEIVKLSFIFIV